jgi:chromate reductase
MSEPHVLVFSASLRPGSFNTRLAGSAAKSLALQGAAVTLLDLDNYSLPIYDARLEAEGMPQAAIALHAEFRSHNGIFIATPEYNSAPPPLLINAFDWISRVTTDGGVAAAFGRQAFALGAASPGSFGGYRSLSALRQMLELGLSARVLPEMVSVPAAHEAFDDAGELKNDRIAGMLKAVTAKLIQAALGR